MSRPSRCQAPRHARQHRTNETASETVGETVSLKAFARAVLARDTPRGRERDHGEPQLVAPLSWFEQSTTPAEGEPGYDEPCLARRGRVETHGAILLHFCAECGAWGEYGHGVDFRAGKLGRWYCRVHRNWQDP